MSTRIVEHDVLVDGVRLHVTEAGSGPVIVLLHGLSGSCAIWEHTIEHLAQRWRVIAPDLPGHGASAKPDAPYTIDFYAGMIRSLGRELALDDAIVVGNSLGGLVALELAVWYPRWTRALVLCAPAGGYSPALRPFGRMLEVLTGQQVLRLSLEQGLAQSFHDRSFFRDGIRRRILDERLAAPDFPDFARAIARSLAGVLTADPTPLERITQPVLVAWGREDRMVPLRRSVRILNGIRHAQFHVIERCGHLPMLEQPAEFNRVLASFLDAAGTIPHSLVGSGLGS